MLTDPSQYSLSFCERENLPIIDGELYYYRNWLSEHAAAQLFLVLQRKVAWQQTRIKLYGKSVPIPRLNAWYGDLGCHYSYSNTQLELLPWLPELETVNQYLSDMLEYRFNSVLVNCYRNGSDSVAWHSDDEPELGPEPMIASVSLGAERRFCLRHRYHNNMRKTLYLENGSLLVMAGKMQHCWQHQLPKTSKIVSTRLNLTFRRVEVSE